MRLDFRKMKLQLWLAVLAFCSFSESAKVLLVFPFPSKSHSILGDGFTKLLLAAGHEVTHITTHPKKFPPAKLYQVDISDNQAHFPTTLTNLSNVQSIMNDDVSQTNTSAFYALLYNLSVFTLNNRNVQNLIQDENQKFDVVIIEWIFSSLYTGLSAIYDCPYIWFSSMDPHWQVMSLIDESLNPAYNPDYISPNALPLSFYQRFQELLQQFTMWCFQKFFVVPSDAKQYENIFGPIMAKKGKTLPPFDEIRYNASLMLGNSHASVGSSIRLPQNYIPIGGFHIDSEVEPLPEKLQKFMDSSERGVVYFSMGSSFKSIDFPENIQKNLLRTFAGLRFKVIWKLEDSLHEDQRYLPGNVYISDWLPQQSILAHPKCRLFITHGGMGSILEAVHFGVPIIGIPVTADEVTNVQRAVRLGFGRRVNLTYDIADMLGLMIGVTIDNPKYREKAKEVSMIYHYRPISPAKSLVFWVEYVIRTNGAAHLRSPALMVPWYQKIYLDWLALISLALHIITVSIKITLRYLRCIRTKNKPQKTIMTKKDRKGKRKVKKI